MATIMLNLPTTDYIGMASYFSYIETVIDNEERVKAALAENMIKVGAIDEASVLMEAEVEQKARAKWNRFKEFIKKLNERFINALDGILMKDKEYLEKYADIIKNKDGRDGLTYEYNGDYNVGTDRLELALPPFNEATHGPMLRQPGMQAISEGVMSSKNFKYAGDDTNLAEQIKQFFLGMDKGRTKGSFENLTKGDFTKMWNYCYKSKEKIDAIKSDIDKLDQSTNAILSMARKSDQNNGEKTGTKANTNTQQNTTGNGGKETQNNTEKTANTATNTTATNNNTETKTESAFNTDFSYLFEAEGDDDKKAGITINDQNENRGNSATKNADNGNAADDKDGNAATTANATEGSAADITNLVNKWSQFCQAFLSGKMTAIERISKDYMAIIKTHVRSYGGKDLKTNNNAEGENAKEGNNEK